MVFLSNAKELLKIQSYIIEKHDIYIDVGTVSNVWGNFSCDRCASWLIVNEDTLAEFSDYCFNSYSGVLNALL